MAERNLEDLLIGKYMNKTAELLPDQRFNPLQQYSVVCLFFAASWCPPCQNFLPKLIEFYNEVNIEEQLLEIVFVPKEEKKENFEVFIKEFPWISIPFRDSRINKLVEAHDIKAIPVLGVLNKKGEIVNMHGKKDVCEMGEAAFLKWIEQIGASAQNAVNININNEDINNKVLSELQLQNNQISSLQQQQSTSQPNSQLMMGSTSLQGQSPQNQNGGGGGKKDTFKSEVIQDRAIEKQLSGGGDSEEEQKYEQN